MSSKRPRKASCVSLVKGCAAKGRGVGNRQRWGSLDKSLQASGERIQEGFLNGCCGRILGQAAVSHALYITLGLF